MIFLEQVIIDYNDTEAYYIQIYNYFKKQIIDGILKKNEKLPSIRRLSVDIKVSKTTVESAYNQLVVEGYINNVPKKGYFVVELRDYSFAKADSRLGPVAEERRPHYINNGVDRNSFDMKVWRKLYGNVLQDWKEEIFTPGDYQGELLLRKEIWEFVQKSRGVKCSRDQIVIGAGVQYLLGILCSLLKDNHYDIAFEYPGFIQAKNIFEDYDMDIVSIPVSKEGIDLDRLRESKVKMVYLSPSHQYPTGSVMPIDKRIEVLNWARKNDSIIIEDDYDCLIRYESRPIPALQGLDKSGHVIYLGSFSKILLPSIRVSYMILPLDILGIYNREKFRYTQSSSKIEQLTLAKFMGEGHLEKHLRRIRKLYHKKNELIVNFIERNARDKIIILGHDSGLHMMFEVNTEKTEREIIREARKHNIYLEMVEGFHKGMKLVVFPYSGLEIGKIEDSLNILVNDIF